MLALMYVLSDVHTLLPAMFALGLHESAHLLTALRLHARVDEIELMPFGAAIRLYELWELSPRHMLIIALAGPLSNFAAATLLALPVYWFPSMAFRLIPLMRVNLAVMLTNLLPALPLDGGRAFCALLNRRFPRAKCVRIGIWSGRLLAFLLLVLTAYLLFTVKKLQLLPLLAAVYIIASAEQERRQSEGAALRSLLLSPYSSPAPARWILVRENDRLLSAARNIQSGTPHLFAVVDETGKFLRVVTENELSRALQKDPSMPFSALTQ